MTGLLNIVADPATFATVLRVMTPLLIAALGILISDRAGVFNLGMEGMMLTGALVGVLGTARRARRRGPVRRHGQLGFAQGFANTPAHRAFSV